MTPTPTLLAPARRSDRGAAMLEFALVAVVLISLLTGIISFGLILAFNQNITQAAAEGARAGAIALAGSSEADAELAVDQAVEAFGQTCGTGGLTCDVAVHDCGTSPGGGDNPAIDNCVTVSVTYDYANNPILPEFPILSRAYPRTLSATSVAQVNPITTVVSTTAPPAPTTTTTTTSTTTTTTSPPTTPTTPTTPSTTPTTPSSTPTTPSTTPAPPSSTPTTPSSTP